MFSRRFKLYHKNKNNNISADEKIKEIIRETNNNCKYSFHLDIKSPRKINRLVRNKRNFSTINIKKANASLKEQDSLIFNLQNNITKETLIIELRDELKYHLKCNLIYKSFLAKSKKIKELVENNKKKVQQNADLLRDTFKDRFNVIDRYEKTISLLNEEKKDILKSNKDILEMRKKTFIELQEQFNQVQRQANEQNKKIEELDKKVKSLEYKKDHIQEELQKQLEKDEQNFLKHVESYRTLCNKYEYFLEEYNTYDKTGDEKTQVEVKLFDDTNAKYSLIEEDLKVKLNDKLLKKNNLINQKSYLIKEIKILEDKQKEEQMNEEKKNKFRKIGTFRTNKLLRNNSTFAKTSKYNKHKKMINFGL